MSSVFVERLPTFRLQNFLKKRKLHEHENVEIFRLLSSQSEVN